MSLRFRSTLALSLAIPFCVHAADFTVTRFDDPVPGACAPADCSLREALLAANALAGNDRVLLAAGDYALNRTAPNPPDTPAGTSGPLVADDTVEIIGAGRDDTRITASLGMSGILLSGTDDAVLTTTLRDLAIEDSLLIQGVPIASGTNSRLTLERIAMRNNTGSIGGVAAFARLTIIDSLFESNTSLDEGPIVQEYIGPTVITGSEFRNNSMNGDRPSVLALGLEQIPIPPLGDRVVRDNLFAGNLSGGGGAVVKMEAGNGVNRLDLTDNVFEDNHGTGRGGAVWVLIGSSSTTTRVEVDASGSSFIGNSATTDCGAFAFDAPTNLLVAPELTLTLARFEDNASDGDGGALCSSGATTITQTAFAANATTDGRGGAIFHNFGTLLINQSTLSGNSATSFGGAIAAYDPVEIRRSTLDGNSTDAIGGGGGLYVAGGGASLLRNVTLFGNRADGLANALRVLSAGAETTLRLDNSIVQGSCTTNTAAALLDSQHNIESPGDTCDLGALNNSRNVIPADLALGPLTDNGGPTLTRMPQAGSVALNRIIVIPSCTQVDQRGYVGTGGNCDIGAVEAAAVLAEPLPPEIFDDGFE